MLKDVIKSARIEKGYTQEEIATLVKVAKQTYLKWENGETEPKATQIKLLAINLNVTADEICNGTRYEKVDLEDFIIGTAISRAPREIITMYTWKMIPDHGSFFDKINHIEMDENEYYNAIGEVGSIEQSFGRK
ncbi:helix-turn-helix transcriptional regulator [uncultured Aliivibrio sp.]|uniref:helix-turn-helix transcriptional regulator n=1 Tax=uncultured Aliivibrio sp. TaxID=873085 RepID=UPI00262F1724|nr:helix-turn-helix transcriptional regulator [uncultured Aliivibrio sp.]